MPCRARIAWNGCALLVWWLGACGGDGGAAPTADAQAPSEAIAERDAAVDAPASERDATADATASAPGASGCTRAALSMLVDSYFAALAAHDPSSLPVADDIKVTENGQLSQLGEGLWRAAGAAAFRRNVLDTERCATLTQAVLDNEGGRTIVGVRLKLEDGKLSEVESLVVPSAGFLVNPDGVANDGGADWEGVLPPEQRSTRAELDAIAEGYFELFGASPPEVPFAAQCQRFENGSVAPGVMHCSDGIPSGISITARRYPVADLEAGIAVGFALFLGSLDFHMFKVRNGEVVGIHATLGARASASGWE